jgi:hypothetical protein
MNKKTNTRVFSGVKFLYTGGKTQGSVCLNLSAVPFQRNNSVFFSQQISISISRFFSQPNRAQFLLHGIEKSRPS